MKTRVTTTAAAALLVVVVLASPAWAQRTAPAPQGPASPIVRAAEEARVQGEPRTDQQVLPQVNVPLRRGADEAGIAGPGTVDDDAARCLARPEAAARAACQRRLQP